MKTANKPLPYKEICLAYARQAMTNIERISQRWPHWGNAVLLPHPIFIAQETLDFWAHQACEIAELLAQPKTHSAGLPSLNKTLINQAPDCFSVDFAITDNEGELSIKLIEAQAFPSVMRAMLDLEEIFNHEATIGGLSTHERKALCQREINQHLPVDQVVMLDQNIINQGTAIDFISSLDMASPRSVLDIYEHHGAWMHLRDDGAHRIQRCYHRSIFHTLNEAEQKHILALLDAQDISHFNHPAWYYKIDKASLGRIEHWSIPHTYALEQASELRLNNMVLKHPNGFGGKEVFIAPNMDDIQQAPKHSILQEKVEYAAFHPAYALEHKKFSDNNLCVELRFMLLHTVQENTSHYIPVATLARATRDGNLMRFKEQNLPGEGYTCAIGYK